MRCSGERSRNIWKEKMRAHLVGRFWLRLMTRNKPLLVIWSDLPKHNDDICHVDDGNASWLNARTIERRGRGSAHVLLKEAEKIAALPGRDSCFKAMLYFEDIRIIRGDAKHGESFSELVRMPILIVEKWTQPLSNRRDQYIEDTWWDWCLAGILSDIAKTAS